MYMKKEYHCPVCGREIIDSETEGYRFQCLRCDEDFTESEVIIRNRKEETMKKKNNTRQEEMEFLYGKENADKSMYRTVHETHYETIRECEYCGKPLTPSEANDYGTLCESCYMKEYYGDE